MRAAKTESKNRGQFVPETQTDGAAMDAAAGQNQAEPQTGIAGGGTLSDTIEQITRMHRKRRYAMKLQQKIDRALKSYARREYTEWRFDLPEEERERFNKQTRDLITAARNGNGDPALIGIVAATDASRKPTDDLRKEAEKVMEKLARSISAWPWVEGIRGAAELGLATIVAETGDLANYPSPAHVWSRLGYAPYDGRAGSSWKREAWRPRALTKAEWIEHPFSGERYALFFSLSDSLFRAQWKQQKKPAPMKVGRSDHMVKPTLLAAHTPPSCILTGAKDMRTRTR